MQQFRRRLLTASLALVVLTAAYTDPSAQAPAKKVLSTEDYAKWKTIAGQDISDDGKWVTYTVQLTNTIAAEAKPVLYLKNLETDAEVTVQHATGGTFSSDSKWIAYQVDPGAAERARRERNAQAGSGGPGSGGPGSGPGQPPTAPPATPPTTPPATPPGEPPAQPPATPATGAQQGGGPRGGGGTIPPRRVELRNLETGAVQSWQDIGTFTFSPTSTHLMLRRRAPEGQGGAGGGRGAGPGGGAPGGAPGGGAAAASSSTPRGLDVLLVDLKTGRHQLLGSVGDITFNRTGDLLAYTVDAAVKDANGAFVMDMRSGRTTPLDTDAKQYNRLTWNDEGNALAVLKGLDVEKKREKNNVLLAFTDVKAAVAREMTDGEAPAAAAGGVVLDPEKNSDFPKGWVISDRATLAWSEDSKRVFFGMKEQANAPETNQRRNADENADVDVWNTADERIQSQQIVRAEQERNFTYREAFDVSTTKYIKLADETMRDVDIAPDGKWAVGRDMRGFVHDFKRAAADIYRVNTATGERTLMLKAHLVAAGGVLGVTPHGKHFMYWKDSRFHAYEFDSGKSTPLATATASFANMEYDHPGPRPSYGIAGYTKDGKAAIAQARYDLWLLPLDGSAATNLTNGIGAKNEIQFRPARTEPVDPMELRAAGPRGSIDLSKPIHLAAYGEYTKKSGLYELANRQLKELVYDDASYSTPSKALRADKYLFSRQTFAEYPDIRVSGPAFTDAKKISDVNPQQSEYLWGKRILFDYKNKDGVRLQGILAIPDDYKPGEKRPMIVTFYEKNSQNLHRYSSPSFLTGMGSSPMEAVSRGYLTMMPDVHFRTGNSHSDMLECVEAATRKVIEMGYADPKRIGVNGHSYGGEGAAFISVQSKIFAAVGMGAGVTDLYNDFFLNWGWAYSYQGGSGANAFDYYIYGQGRWGFTPYDQPEKYRFESALTHAGKASQPILIMHGTSDPTVGFNQAVTFYNALRYHGKKAYLLAYPGEGHGLRGLANRKDLTIRFFQFFDHYLKDAPAPKWMTDGVPYLKKDEAKEPK
jgi:dipeptidyl aminopeptidase/acylaminoacyl peptidase